MLYSGEIRQQIPIILSGLWNHRHLFPCKPFPWQHKSGCRFHLVAGYIQCSAVITLSNFFKIIDTPVWGVCFKFKVCFTICCCHCSVIVRRAGLLWSQQDFEWRWSVPLFKCLTVLEFSFILFDLCLLITFFQFYYELCTYCNILDIYLS